MASELLNLSNKNFDILIPFSFNILSNPESIITLLLEVSKTVSVW